MAARRYVLWLTITILIAASLQLTVANGALQVGFYDSSCSSAESVVKSAVQSAVSSDSTIAASLIRLHFHDCFVQGCDASILLTGTGTEQTALPNLSVRGYSVISDAKSQLEAVCPGVVSCADITALAARDSVEIVRIMTCHYKIAIVNQLQFSVCRPELAQLIYSDIKLSCHGCAARWSFLQRRNWSLWWHRPRIGYHFTRPKHDCRWGHSILHQSWSHTGRYGHPYR